jgi:hypothetical protein
MEKIPSAEEMFEANPILPPGVTRNACIAFMRTFAKLHVEAALKEASDKATWQDESFDTCFGDLRDFDFIDSDGSGDPSTGHNVFVDKDSILNSYPLSNIK